MVIFSIVTLKLEAPIFAATSFLMALLGLILIILPDLKRIKMRPRQPLVRGELPSTKPLLDEMSDKCAICGKPVPPDVAYCDECAKKR